MRTICLWNNPNRIANIGSGHLWMKENLGFSKACNLVILILRCKLQERLIGSYTSPYWRSGISSTSVRNSVFSRVERSGTSGKTLNFSHEWKKCQIFNKDECKYLFLPFQLKNKACRFHSFIRMSMSCLLHKILQRHVQCSKYTLI